MAKKELDKLSLDMIECEKAGFGCHYGRWKAMQGNQVAVKKKDEIPEGWKVCPQCGKSFKPKKGTRQTYCEVYCQKLAQAMRRSKKNRERQKRYRERKKERETNES